MWAAGITRHAFLAFGARLVAAGRLHEPAHLIECDPDEIRALLAGAAAPGADELAERADDRAARRASDAPPFLGDPPQPPAPLDGLPPDVARLMRALGTAVDALFAPSQAVSDAAVVRGTGASPGTFAGIARVVNGPAEFGRLQPGDVLVTSTTTEAFNIVLPMIGAIVTRYRRASVPCRNRQPRVRYSRCGRLYRRNHAHQGRVARNCERNDGRNPADLTCGRRSPPRGK